MRKDIEIHINTGDITLPAKNRTVLRDFRWVERPTDMEQRYLYGEVTIPATQSEESIKTKGVYIVISYTPIYKEFKLRFKREYGSEHDTYMTNPVDGTEWFLVQAGVYGQKVANIYASELITISEDRFYCTFNCGLVTLYSGNESDFNIINANTQNKNMMLACVPSNNYRYPLLGVGLIRWANSKIDVAGLAEVLQSEFSNDGTPVISAEYDHEQRKLYLELDTSLVDSNGKV